jgi:hypothetical protein
MYSNLAVINVSRSVMSLLLPISYAIFLLSSS